MSTPTPLEQWSMIRPHIPDAAIVAFGEEYLRDRFLAGAAEHRGQWLRKPLQWFRDMQTEERADDVLYGAMGEARRERILDAALWGAA